MKIKEKVKNGWKKTKHWVKDHSVEISVVGGAVLVWAYGFVTGYLCSTAASEEYVDGIHIDLGPRRRWMVETNEDKTETGFILGAPNARLVNYKGDTLKTYNDLEIGMVIHPETIDLMRSEYDRVNSKEDVE